MTDYWHGYMEGAVMSGFRAAVEVLYEIRPMTIKISDLIKMRYLFVGFATTLTRFFQA